MKQFFAALLLFSFASMTLAGGVAGPMAGIDSANGYKVEAIGALTDAKVPEPARKALDSKGVRVINDKGAPFCEIWFSKSVPNNKGEVAGAFFGQIGEGTFVGVINFPSAVTDYRGQSIKPGYYTLRYGLIMQDGNHLGVSISRDFFMVSPVANDKDPATQLKAEDLQQLSRGATESGHPSVWSLVQVNSSEGLPKVIKDETERVILEISIPTGGGGQAIGMIIVGKAEG